MNNVDKAKAAGVFLVGAALGGGLNEASSQQPPTAQDIFGPHKYSINADNYVSYQTNEQTGQVTIIQVPKKCVKE